MLSLLRDWWRSCDLGDKITVILAVIIPFITLYALHLVFERSLQ